MDDVLVPLFAILCVFGLPVGAFIVFRVLAHRERMEMIRHGIVPPNGGKGGARYANPQPPYGSDPLGAAQPDASVMLRKGIQLAFVGMALTIGLSFIGYHSGEDVTHVGNVVIREGSHFNFGPWLLGGLIPLFIGLSQVAIAFLTDPGLFARYRKPAPGAYYGGNPRYPDPPPPPSPPGSDPGNDGPYTYRPGGRQELRPPTPPPTRRP